MDEEKKLENVNMCAIYLVKTLCVDTNAETAKYTLSGFHDKEKTLGDYEITIKKIK